MISRVRAVIRNNVPAWLNVEVNRYFIQNLREALTPPTPSKSFGPHWRRIAQVYKALDQAEAGATYSTLIQHVRQVTGTGCSRKLIAKWKRERGLR
ncbi:hypothetical protein [Acaryochloris marina]|uniref:hypothetical protein n=1 Tax=Acaryochloris marina TaxID=155978 RepID=UPI00030835F1|nr:hypothetical protein [Acaryochloris marina]BDM79539.1 hypothetical protein AM10699_24070 [Acaryochloris marina MBIC10699]BDM81156.1 hypothetical protein AM10699_40230 [Acaryochloris marina MBIC10699]